MFSPLDRKLTIFLKNSNAVHIVVVLTRMLLQHMKEGTKGDSAMVEAAATFVVAMTIARRQIIGAKVAIHFFHQGLQGLGGDVTRIGRVVEREYPA